MKRKILAAILSVTMLFSAMSSGISVLAAGAPAASAAIATELSNLPQADGNTLRMWYTKPASNWTNDCLVIGNGSTGGVLFSGVGRDRVHFNEKTLWNGGPGSVSNYNGGNRTTPTTKEQLDAIREQADDHSTSVFPLGTGGVRDFMGTGSGMGQYQDFGDLYLDFSKTGMTDANATNYVRDLDMRTAVSSLNYDYDGVHYEREYFVSHPDKVMAVRLTASEAGKLTFDASVAAASGLTTTATAQDGRITLAGTVNNNGMKCEMQAQVINEGGTLTNNDDGTVSVEGADAVTIVLTTGTDYANDWPTYRTDDPHDELTATVDAAAAKSYQELKDAHLADYQELFSRLEIDLGGECPQVPTDEMMKAYRRGETSHAAEEMVYQFGRYLTIAGSREGDELPTNLCGLWLIGSASSYWGADFHFNVNVQMNYWPAYQTNLAECGSVFTDYMESLVEPGRVTAGASAALPTEPGTPIGEGNGFLVNTQNNPFGCTAPFGSQEYGWNIGGSSWALQNVYDQYLYTGDKELLKNKIYPMLKEQANFWNQFLWYSDYQGRLVVGPSVSAEQGPTVNGTTYDQSIVWELYKMAIEASEILGVDEDQRAVWEDKQSQLNPIIIGSQGQVKEWYEESTLGKGQVDDLAEVNIPNFGAGGSANAGSVHRHTSQLIGLYPGTLINQDTPEWMDAAVVSLQQRNMGGTGWSKAHKINMYARTGRAEDTYSLVTGMIAGNQNGILDNLLDSHPPFQIDGNYGLTAGMNEMLIQSQAGYTEFLPTLPQAWATGSISGVMARGNFEIDMDWSNGEADRFVITSKVGGTFTGEYDNLAAYTVKTSDGTPVETTKLSDSRISFETTEGESYIIDFNNTPTKLQLQIDDAKEIASQMQEDILSTAKAALESCIAESEQIIENQEADKYYDQKVLLTEACKTANAAISLKDAYTAGRLAYGDVDPDETWATYQQLAADLKVQIDAAVEVLTREGATAADYSAVQAALTAATTALTGLSDRLTVSISPQGGQVNAGQQVTLSSEFSDLQIRYTTDGNEPMSFSNIYTAPLTVPTGGMVVKAALYSGTRRMSDVYTASFITGTLGENVAPTATEVIEDNNYGSGYDGKQAVDGNTYTRWATVDNTNAVTLELVFAQPVTVDSAAIRQYYYNGKNDITNFNIEYWNGTDWVAALTGASMDRQSNKTFGFEEFTADRIRLNILAGTNPSIWEFELYKPVKVDPIETNKTILEKVIAGAKAAIDSGEVDKAIESVRNSFMEMYNYAVAVNENPTSDQETIDRSWVALMTEIHKLGLIAGDKTTLQEHYDYYSQLDMDRYMDGAEKDNFLAALDGALKVLNDGDAMDAEISAADTALVAAANALVLRGDKEALQTLVDSTQGYVQDRYVPSLWAEFQAKRDAANAVLEEANVTQEQVDEAMNNLLTAMLNLRYKADKSVLEALVSDAGKLDLNGFSKASVDAFNAAYADAQAALANEDLSEDDQAVVDGAVAGLQKAIEGLTYSDGTSAGISVNGDGSIHTTGASAKTGETVPVAAAAAMLLIAGAAVMLGRKKRS